MKKLVAILLALTLCASAFTACAKPKSRERHRNRRTHETSERVSDDEEEELEEVVEEEAEHQHETTTETSTEITAEVTEETTETTVSSISYDYEAAYIQTINDYVANYTADQELLFNLIRFDDSGIPALTITCQYYNVSMYIYRDGAVHQVIDRWGYGAFGINGYEYALEQGVIYYSDADYAGALRYDNYLTLTENYEFESICGDLHSQYFEGEVPGDTYLDTPLYYVDGQQVSEEVYLTYGVDGDFFSLIGDYTYDEIMAFLTTETIPTVSTYEVVMQDVTWEEANTLAVSRGGHLATINTDGEYYQILSAIMYSSDINGVYYVGGSCVDGQYVWTADNSMQPISEHWRSGEPSYSGSTEDGRTVDESYVCLCAFFVSDNYYNYELMDIPNDTIDAAPTYAGNIGYIIEYEH